MKDFWQFPDGVDGPWADQLDLPGAVHAVPGEPRADSGDGAAKVWAFLGDGEMDEPESTGAIGVARAGEAGQPDLCGQLQSAAAGRAGARATARSFRSWKALFRGAGWNVIKCMWGCELGSAAREGHHGRLVQLMNECVDGDYQAFKAQGGAYVRKEFFGTVSGDGGAGRGHDRRRDSVRCIAAGTIR